jgi:hypothetical protein
VPLPEYDVFKDAAFQQPQRSRSSTLVSGQGQGQGQGQSTGGVAATGVQNWEALVSVELLRTAYFPVVSMTSSEAISLRRVACLECFDVCGLRCHCRFTTLRCACSVLTSCML